jgi:hypothetical protein
MAPYVIRVNIIQTRCSPLYSIVEKTNFHEGTWSEDGNEQILTMAGSGVSGMLRFKSSQGDSFFLVALGVHNYKRWCDIVVDATPTGNTCVDIHPQYYNADSPRYQMLWKQLAHLEKSTSTGVKIAVNYHKDDDNLLGATIIIN